ncbi:MAG: PEP-CTERM sorting domain-containing protein [Planctomycetota bacterium]
MRKRTTMLAAAATLATASFAAGAQVYFEDFSAFDGAGGNQDIGLVGGFVINAGYNPPNYIGLPGNSFNGSAMGFFDTDQDGTVFTEWGINTGQTAAVDDVLTLTFDLGTNFGTPGGDFTARVLVDGSIVSSEVFAVTDTGTGLSVTTPALASGGAISVEFLGEGASGTGYGQYQIDNIGVDATPIPEPAGIAGVVLLGGLLARRRR